MRPSTVINKQYLHPLFNNHPLPLARSSDCAPLSGSYQRTGAALKSTGEKASGLFAGLGAKFSEARESAAFKNMEERMGTMVNSVKVRARALFMPLMIPVAPDCGLFALTRLLLRSNLFCHSVVVHG